jgi:hypothetical protein
MSYALSGPLQSAVYASLVSDQTLGALVGDAIYDALPAGLLPRIYVQLGSESVRDASDGSGDGAFHSLTISVVSQDAGFADAKKAATAICDRLQDADLTLSRGRLISLRFERGSAKFINAAQVRQIDMRFRARVQDG